MSSGDVCTDGLFQCVGVAPGWDGYAQRNGGEDLARMNISCLVCNSQSSVYTDDCYFGVFLGPSPGDGLLLHVRLTGRRSSSTPYPVSFYPIHLWVCAHRLSSSHPLDSDSLIFDQCVMLSLVVYIHTFQKMFNYCKYISLFFQYCP